MRRKSIWMSKKACWCHLPVLDAVFSAYFNQAQQQGIRLETKIASLNTLPVEESELAIVLANALENAIHANKDLPPEQKEIRCKMVGAPSVMVEISNPYTTPVTFNDQGLPVSSKEGHGFGVQSIAAFCKKHGAVCQFEAAEGRFCLKLML
ncbi:GHKL domain-containing protein [Ruminococcaceae bacterium AM28-23LB]|nr:GHKL domain-containing protein [Ruminococcaceae bacterium AM28-23LB]